ncbi:tyrosine-type recombinase/integrase [Planotetraspora kaengkrachanensis]|uniref:Tyr recombinase domain-containing protein n=1 Tax=Planotetraspora kaengkrachanensis TaxID=575193 RepID=A0A8J3M5H6_9ACTN|nr:hypothetical protein Pka01_27380 [Planotetraspora kaengkrachanensis]
MDLGGLREDRAWALLCLWCAPWSPADGVAGASLAASLTRPWRGSHAERRAAGKDSPRTPRSRDTDGHIPRDWFRKQVWIPALSIAGLQIHVRMHGLRHAHASWLLAGGADLQVVKERLGHASIATTEKYLHTLPDADETALDAVTKIRIRGAD